MRSFALMYNGNTLDQVDDMGGFHHRRLVPHPAQLVPRLRPLHAAAIPSWTWLDADHGYARSGGKSPSSAKNIDRRRFDVQGQSVALLMEDGVYEPINKPRRADLGD